MKWVVPFIGSILLAAAAYVMSLSYVFPGYLHPLSAHHSDMYWAVKLHAGDMGLVELFSYPRPVLMLVLKLVGYFGFEGSLVFFIIVNFVNLALFRGVLCELGYTLSFPAFFIVCVIVFSSPGFYISHTHDNGATLAVAFGLAGVLSLSRGRSGYIVGFLLLLCSTLCKESFVLVAFMMSIALIWEKRVQMPVTDKCVVFLAPVVSLIFSVAFSRWVNSSFVNLGAGVHDPYHISLSISDVFSCLTYYLAPAGGIIPFVLLSGFLLVLRPRYSVLVALLFFSGLMLVAPYCVLPNHKMEYYYYVPYVPWVFLGIIAMEQMYKYICARSRIWGKIVFAACLFCVWISISLFRSENQSRLQWNLAQEQVNRNILGGLRNIKGNLVGIDRVILVGFRFPLHPLAHGEFLARELNYGGTWLVAVNAGSERQVNAFRFSSLDWSSIAPKIGDLILYFSSDGNIANSVSGKDMIADIYASKLLPDDCPIPLLSAKALPIFQSTKHGDLADVAMPIAEKLLATADWRLIPKLNVLVRLDRVRNPYLFYFLGKSQEMAGNFGDALKSYSRALALEPASGPHNPYFEADYSRMLSLSSEH